MGNTACKGYTDVFGKHGVWIGDHTGPASYTQWTAPNTGGDSMLATNFGLRSIDFADVMGISQSGTYAVLLKYTSTASASVTKIIMVWYPIATIGVTQVTGATNLKGETIRLIVVGG